MPVGLPFDTQVPAWALFISYLIVLFPPLDVVSAFPLNGLTLGNNMLTAFVTDPAKQQATRYAGGGGWTR